VQEEAAQAGAALACGAHGGKENGTRRKVEIGGRRDEGAIVPPSSRIDRPNLSAIRGATARPIRVDPVALTSGTSGFPASACPSSGPPRMTAESPGGIPSRPFAARSSSAWHARAQSGVFSEGFQTSVSPHTRAIAAFHAHTATGKLKALMMPTTPSGCHVSIILWPGRSLAMVRP